MEMDKGEMDEAGKDKGKRDEGGLMEVEGWWGRIKGEPVAQRHQMVSSSLALLNRSFPIIWILVFFVAAGQRPR